MSSDSEESFSSDNLDVEIINKNPRINEISILFSQYPYISNPIKFLENISQSYVLVSGDLTLAVGILLDYNNIKGCIEKRFKKTLNNLVEKINGTVAFFFCPRISNTPVNFIYKLYSKIDLTFEHYIVVSRLYKLDKSEEDEVFTSFKEFNPDDLRYFPVLNEEVFFLNSKIRQNTEIKGSQARIYILSKDEFQSFMKSFANELNQ